MIGNLYETENVLKQQIFCVNQAASLSPVLRHVQALLCAGSVLMLIYKRASLQGES